MMAKSKKDMLRESQKAWREKLKKDAVKLQQHREKDAERKREYRKLIKTALTPEETTKRRLAARMRQRRYRQRKNEQIRSALKFEHLYTCRPSLQNTKDKSETILPSASQRAPAARNRRRKRQPKKTELEGEISLQEVYMYEENLQIVKNEVEMSTPSDQERSTVDSNRQRNSEVYAETSLQKAMEKAEKSLPKELNTKRLIIRKLHEKYLESDSEPAEEIIVKLEVTNFDKQ